VLRREFGQKQRNIKTCAPGSRRWSGIWRHSTPRLLAGAGAAHAVGLGGIWLGSISHFALVEVSLARICSHAHSSGRERRKI
jgi:hypothetical protein